MGETGVPKIGHMSQNGHIESMKCQMLQECINVPCQFSSSLPHTRQKQVDDSDEGSSSQGFGDMQLAASPFVQGPLIKKKNSGLRWKMETSLEPRGINF